MKFGALALAFSLVGAAQAAHFFTVDATANNLMRVGTDGSMAVVGALGFDVTNDVDLAWYNGTLYALETVLGSSVTLHTINHLTGAKTASVGLGTGTQQFKINLLHAEGLAGGPNGLYIAYSLFGNTTSNGIGTVNLGNGIVTQIGTTVDGDGLAYKNGELWANDSFPGGVTDYYKGAPASVNTYVGSNTTAVLGQDNDIDFAGASLYSITINRGLKQIDPATGAVVSSLQFNTSNYLSGLATDPVPEPATLAALAIGLAALRRRR